VSSGQGAPLASVKAGFVTKALTLNRHGVAIGRCPRRLAGAHIASATEYVLNIELLAELLGEFLGDEPAKYVARTSWPERHNYMRDAADLQATPASVGTVRIMLGTSSRMFGLYDRVACSVCGQDMYLRRRSPHTADGDACEFQIFACRTCNASTTRIVDSTGRPRPER
jgi:hypothetical protein